jgi:hypothetical protein
MTDGPEVRNYQTKPKNLFESMLPLFWATNEAKKRLWWKALGGLRGACAVPGGVMRFT